MKGNSASKSNKKIKPEYEGSNNIVLDNSDKKITTNSNKKDLNKLQLMKQYEKSLKDDSSEEETSNTGNKSQPKDFEKTWRLIEEMRELIEAPVDTLGAEVTPYMKEDRKTFKFQALISLLLSSQTKDPITYKVMDKLINFGLSVDKMIETEEEIIKDMIYGVSFYNNKAKYIKKLAEKLKDDFESDPPEILEEVLKLPGIGPKMAFLYLQFCCGKTEGIAVDTHVHRICNRLKWVNNTKTPENTRTELEKWLSKDKWAEINHLLVGFGQTICSAVAPKCQECKLNKSCEFGKERIQMLKEKKLSKKSKQSDSKSPLKTTPLKRSATPTKENTSNKKRK